MRGTEGDVSRKHKQKEPITMQTQTPMKAKPVKGTPTKKRKAMTQGESNLIIDAEKYEPAIRLVMSTLNELKVQDTEIANFVIKVKSLQRAFGHHLFQVKQMIQSLSCFDSIDLYVDPTQTSKSPLTSQQNMKMKKDGNFF